MIFSNLGAFKAFEYKGFPNFIPEQQIEISTLNGGIVSDGNEPIINGSIGASEWQNATIFNRTDERGWMVVYILRNSTYLFFAVEVYDVNSPGTEFLVLFFDEGDDGLFGSGSWDHNFTENQDDCKAMYDDGTLFDGSFDSSSLPVYSTSQVDFQGVTNYYSNHFEFELAIPLVGVDGRSFDYSDLNVTLSDTIGFDMYYSNTFQSTNLFGLNVFDTTYINLTSMEIGAAETFDIGIVADGKEPNINGTIISSEWSNALYFPYMDTEGTAEVYLLRNSSHLMMAASLLDTTYSVWDEITVYFDEGNNSTYGSGSRDAILRDNQEDCKVLRDATLNDGYFSTPNFQSSPDELGFIGFMEYYGDHWEMELSMPLIGDEGKAVDFSDLNASIIDEIGVLFEMEDTTNEITYFPSHASNLNRPQDYLKLKLGYLIGSQSDTINYQSGKNGKIWLNGSAFTDAGNLSRISVYPPNPDTTNATGVTWSTNQGTNQSWAFYNTSYIPSGRYWTKINISNDQGSSYASYINLTVEYCVDFLPPTGNQDPSTNASNAQNGGLDSKFWINGTASDSLSGLQNVSVYAPGSDTTNATGVTWSDNQGNLSSWVFYNTSTVTEGIYWIKIKIEDKLGNYFNLTTNVSFKPNNPPQLSDENLVPTSGNVSTIYNFTINYTDPDNDPPSFIYLSLNQLNNISMSKLNVSDDDYTDGVIYWYQSLLGSGNYSVGYYTSDGIVQVNYTTSQNATNTKLISSSGLQVIPTIDGSYNLAAEWSDATFIHDPSVSLPYYFYIKNDESDLYFLVDFIGDTGSHALSDYIAYYFDIQNDDFLTTNSEAKISQALGNTLKLKWYWNGIAWLNNNSAADVGVDCHASFGSSINSPSSHSIYECKIPLDYLNVTPGETIGFGLWVNQLNPGASVYYFPTDFSQNNPVTYSDLMLNLTINYPQINLLEPTNVTYSMNSVPIVVENTTDIVNAWVRNRTGGAWSNNVSLIYNGTHWVNNTVLLWPEGQFQLQVFANDSIGTEAMVMEYFSIDSLIPQLLITSPSNGSLLSGPQTWINGTVNSTGSFIKQIMINSTDFEISADPTNTSYGPFSFKNNTAVMGNYTINMTVIDDAGWINSSIIMFAVDNLAPVLNLSTPATAGISGPLWFNGTVNGTGSKITLFWNDSRISAVVDPNGTISGSFALVNNTIIPDGLFVINLTVVDQVGLKYEHIKSVYIDNTIPNIIVTTPLNGSSVAGDTIWINGTVNATGSLVSLMSMDNLISFSFESIPLGQTVGNFAIKNISLLSDGLHHLIINVTDLAGNVNFTIITFTVDNLANLNPTIQLTLPAQDNTIITGPLLSLEGNVFGVSSNVDGVWTNDSTTWVLSINPSGTFGGPFRFINTSFVRDGVHAVNITVNNTEGNSTSLVRTFIVDNLVPELNCSNLRYAGDAQGSGVIEFSGFANGTGSPILNLTINDSRFNLVIDPIGTSFGNYRFVNNTYIPEGLTNVTLYISDNATLYILLNLSCFVDLTSPTAPVSFSHSLAGRNVVLSWTAVTDLTNVSYLIIRNEINIENVTGTFFVDENLPVGTYVYKIYVIDNAGHVSSTFKTLTVSIAGPGPNPAFILIIIGIIVAALAAAAGVFIFRRTRKQASLISPVSKGGKNWVNRALDYSSEQEGKLFSLYKDPQKINEIRDPELAQIFRRPFTILSPSLLSRLNQLIPSDKDRIEILQALLLLPEEQREEFIDEILSEEREDS